jgi:hypothetical protein
MLLDLQVGSLVEPLNGRRWDRPHIQREFYNRSAMGIKVIQTAAPAEKGGSS